MSILGRAGPQRRSWLPGCWRWHGYTGASFLFIANRPVSAGFGPEFVSFLGDVEAGQAGPSAVSGVQCGVGQVTRQVRVVPSLVSDRVE
jgi:hypothetical protein